LLYVMSTIGYISICAEIKLELPQSLKQIIISNRS
jgi:hypothetical protein